jgi:hypothetical protein
VGKDPVRKGLVESAGAKAKVVAADWESEEGASQFSYGAFLQV